MDAQELQQHSQRLRDTLAKRKIRRQPLSGGSKSLLRQAVLQLIDHHQQFDALLHEAKSVHPLPLQHGTPTLDKDGMCAEGQERLSADCCIAYLKTQSQTTGVPLATLAANVCVAKIGEILHQQEDVKSLHFNPDQKIAMESVLDIICTLKSTQSFNRPQFVKQLNTKGPIPLELLWQLHIKSIMTFDLFITANLGQPNVFTTFTGDVAQCSLMCVTQNDGIFADILKDIVQFLITHGYASRIDVQDQSASASAIQKACVLLLDTIAGKILDSSCDNGPSALSKLLEMARVNPQLPAECLARFFSHQLVLVLGHKADIQVTDAIGSQGQWSFGRAPSGVTDMYRQLLLALECKEAIDIIQRVLEREEVNWKSLLTFTATLLVCFEEAPGMLKDMIDNLLNQSLESCVQDDLIAAFLLARQAANEGPHVFLPYAHWFRGHFGDGASSHLTNKKTVAFFLAFLTSLVPHEPAEYLKAHLKNQPHVPAKCRESVADYNTLAKTRLADLKVPLDSEGIYESTARSSTSINHSGKTQMQDQAMEDVDKAVAAYEKSAKIPTNVLEASIFRRPYYIGRFLPALLTPRLLPDVPDAKMNLIDELKCADKIPSSMVQNYEEACAKEVNALLEGAFTDDAFDDCLEPIDALNVSLEKLPVAVLNSLQTQKSSSNDIAQHISIISDRLGTVLDSIAQQLDEQTGLDADCVILDLDKSTQNIHAQHMQVVDMVLGSFCKTCLAVRSMSVDPETGRSNALWASQVVAMVSKHRSLHVALYHRLWNLTQEQGFTLSIPHTSGIAVFLIHLQVNQHLFPPVFIPGTGSQQTDGSLLHHISYHLRHHSTPWMIFSIRFSSEVIEYVLRHRNHLSSHHDTPAVDPQFLIPREIIKNICYLLPRLCTNARFVCMNGSSSQQRLGNGDQNEGKWASCLALYHTEQFQELVNHYDKFTLTEWVNMELQVQPHHDELTSIQRQDYYRYTIHSHFLTRPNQDGGCAGSYQQACSIILETILDYDVESSISLRRKQGTCCHSNQTKEMVEQRQNGCRSEMIQLLQEMVPLLSSDSTADGSSPWLLSIFHSREKQCEGKKEDVEIQVICFIRLACSLPAYLLLTTNPREIPNRTCMSAAQHFINQHLRTYDQDGAYGLSLTTTSYIARALLHFSHTNTSRTDVCAFIQGVLQGCPLITISLLVHWPKLWPIISSTCNKETPTPLEELNTVYQWALSVSHCYGNQVQIGSTLEGSLLNAEPWLLAVAIVAVILGEVGGNRMKKEEKILLVMELIVCNSNLPKKVGTCAVEYILAHLSWDIVRYNAVTNAASLTAIWKVPDILSAFQEDTTLKKTLLTTSVSRMFPVVFFRILLSTRTADLNPLSKAQQYVHTLLQMHTGLIELHCQAGLDTTKQEMLDADKYAMPLSLEFHLACTKFVHGYIARCPPKLLHSLSPSVISLCDEDIATLIRQRLKNSTSPV